MTVREKARDRLIRLAAAHPDWVLGYQDETWWSRLALPRMHAWTGAGPLRLVERDVPRSDPDPKALSCYGVLRQDTGAMLLRFVRGRPVSQVTEDFLGWVCDRLSAEGKAALLLVWDNASWHISRRVRAWIKARNVRAKAAGGVRIVACPLPVKAPWLNSIEPKWAHGKTAIVEPDRLLTADEVKDRVFAYYGCEPSPPLEQKVAMDLCTEVCLRDARTSTNSSTLADDFLGGVLRVVSHFLGGFLLGFFPSALPCAWRLTTWPPSAERREEVLEAVAVVRQHLFKPSERQDGLTTEVEEHLRPDLVGGPFELVVEQPLVDQADELGAEVGVIDRPLHERLLPPPQHRQRPTHQLAKDGVDRGVTDGHGMFEDVQGP